MLTPIAATPVAPGRHHARADLIDPRRPAPTRSTRRLRGGVTGLQ